MKQETLITTKVTMKALKLIRRIVARTGEKQYRAWERIVEEEYDSVMSSLNEQAKGKSK